MRRAPARQSCARNARTVSLIAVKAVGARSDGPEELPAGGQARLQREGNCKHNALLEVELNGNERMNVRGLDYPRVQPEAQCVAVMPVFDSWPITRGRPLITMGPRERVPRRQIDQV